MSRKESAFDLAKFVDKGIRVKLAGGREGKLIVGRAVCVPQPCLGTEALCYPSPHHHCALLLHLVLQLI
jgi:hypothetical protein